ncbi:uncharacterized protein LOC114544690 isoform X1 [Dendronephthya gigantea]|uniref:uncharacterized protein LOC114544690 isoform X1 n=1 Tax=Dendronephthya gigantea TaxID=151771 RepID=UPI001069962A|nr:uncharacterized protein LOC114544690 isoform X1 [Dendronephthya gigantea]
MKSILLFIALVAFIPTLMAKSDDSMNGMKHNNFHNNFKLFLRALTPCPRITFPCSRIPDVCKNMRNAISKGKPTTLNRITDPKKIAQNRRRSGCPKLPKVSGKNCDEYPFASSRQGGAGAVIMNVPKRENSIQGGLLRGFYVKQKIGNGDCYKVALGP